MALTIAQNDRQWVKEYTSADAPVVFRSATSAALANLPQPAARATLPTWIQVTGAGTVSVLNSDGSSSSFVCVGGEVLIEALGAGFSQLTSIGTCTSVRAGNAATPTTGTGAVVAASAPTVADPKISGATLASPTLTAQTIVGEDMSAAPAPATGDIKLGHDTTLSSPAFKLSDGSLAPIAYGIQFTGRGADVDDSARLQACLDAWAGILPVTLLGTIRLNSSVEFPSGLRLHAVSSTRIISHVTAHGQAGAWLESDAPFFSKCLYGSLATTVASANVVDTKQIALNAALPVGTEVAIWRAETQGGGMYTVESCTGTSAPYTVTMDRPIRYQFAESDPVTEITYRPMDIVVDFGGAQVSGTGQRYFEITAGKDVHIRNVVADATLAVPTDCKVFAFDMYTYDCTYEHCRVIATPATVGCTGYQFETNEKSALIDCRMHSPGLYANIYDGTDISIIDPDVSKAATGIVFTRALSEGQCRNCSVRGGAISVADGGLGAVLIEYADGIVIDHVPMFGVHNTSYNNSLVNVAQTADNVVVKQCAFAGSDVQIRHQASGEVTVRDCTFSEFRLYGISSYDGSKLKVRDSTLVYDVADATGWTALAIRIAGIADLQSVKASCLQAAGNGTVYIASTGVAVIEKSDLSTAAYVEGLGLDPQAALYNKGSVVLRRTKLTAGTGAIGYHGTAGSVVHEEDGNSFAGAGTAWTNAGTCTQAPVYLGTPT